MLRMSIKTLAAVVSVGFGLGFGSVPADASTLYAVSGAGNAPSSLYTVDTTTGAATLVGATGFNHVTGLDFDPVTGVLYGHVSNLFGSGGATQLLTINKTTGAGALVGTSGIQSPDMSFNSAGTLYAWGEFTTIVSDDLYTINLATGAATVVGEAGIGTSNTGIAFNSSDTLYVKSGAQIFTMDAGTGLVNGPSATLDVNLNNALAFDENDALYSIQRSGGTTFLYSIDLGTNHATLVGDMGVGAIAALAFDDVVPTPEPGTLALLGVALAGLGLVRRRKA